MSTDQRLLGILRTAVAVTIAAFALARPAVLAEAATPANVSIDRVRWATGDLEATLATTGDGIRLESLRDLRSARELAVGTAPLFTLVVSNVANPEIRTLTASSGWHRVALRQHGSRWECRWTGGSAVTPASLTVVARIAGDATANAFRWTLRIENATTNWAIRRVVFPQVDVPDLGDDGAVFLPRGPGEVQHGLWNRSFHYRGNYPDGWCAMQFLAAYRGNGPGLYLGLHDPWGSTKHLEVRSDPKTHTVRLAYEIPVANLHRAGNDFVSADEAVWRLLRGDWFDAARIYRDWAKNHARWWPRLGRDGRTDTPPWMRELSAWVMTGGAPSDCVPAVKAFRDALGLPVGFHWYNWHQIPFDNDYPHYFPTKPGFAAGVAELQKAGVAVMPYINGRLWDSHDRGAEDAEFTSVALPAVAKREDGMPFVESYGSKETNSQPVSLGVMCPTTPLWQKRVRDIVLRLQRDEGTRGVYIDQIAAAAPVLCMDPNHGHPLGGGHWWTQGYWDLLSGLRRRMPVDRMITTECNGEAYIRWLDGYLTWHWQYDGQVPAFPAVYGGTIQMFGRAYRGGATSDLAFRMKAGQQLVFGEQIGWFDPGQARETTNFAFARQAIQTRWNHRRYFHAGEMARPPVWAGPMPKVKADWQWSGEWPVTTDAVLVGAWRLPAANRLVVLFANVSDEPVRANFRFDPQAYGLTLRRLQRRISEAGEAAAPPAPVSGILDEALVFAPCSVRSWEFTQGR